jgi:hypothetical protein
MYLCIRGNPIARRSFDKLPDFFVRRLRKIFIPETHSLKRFRGSGANDRVDFRQELTANGGGRNRYSHDDFRDVLLA